ncbi:MAG: DUF3990 domain-containing protein [Synergistaceae bacterium]|jgi:hypothetical protein|nr:DUF3990 domain-containing protein [Synergistaceae bacterium]
MKIDILTLYHGTTHDFTEIDVQKGKPFKDFGQGFYLARIYSRAVNIARRNRKIETDRLRVAGDTTELPVFIYSYEFDLREMEKLNVKLFDTADREWLKFIIRNRMSRTRRHDYDVVIGPTANDDTRASIRAVMNAANGAILSDAALDLLIQMLEPDNLPEQYYFGTSKSTNLLKFKERNELK